MNRRTLFKGIIIILLGLILLANNFQVLPWGVWYQLLRFWPVILIAVGIDLIFKKSSFSFLQVLSPLIIIAAIGGAIYLSQTGITYEKISQTLEFKQPLSPDLRQAHIEINFGAGRLRLKGGSTYLLDGDFTTPSWLKPTTRYKVIDKEGFLELTETGKRGGFRFGRWEEGRFWGLKEHLWNLRLNNEIPLTLKIETGASSNYLDLSSLKVTHLDLDTGASNNEIKFGDLTSIKANIDAGVCQIKLFIPRSVGTRIEADTALTINNLNELGFRKEGDVYISSNYSTAETQLDLELDAGVSNLRVELY